jgi:hypothetical protein
MELNGSQAFPSDQNRPSQDRRQSRPAPVADGVQPWLKEELAESKAKRKAYCHSTTMKKAQQAVCGEGCRKAGHMFFWLQPERYPIENKFSSSRGRQGTGGKFLGQYLPNNPR